MRTTKKLQYKNLPACQKLPLWPTKVNWNLVNHTVIVSIWKDWTQPEWPNYVHIFGWKNSREQIDYLNSRRKNSTANHNSDRNFSTILEKFHKYYSIPYLSNFEEFWWHLVFGTPMATELSDRKSSLLLDIIVCIGSKWISKEIDGAHCCCWKV